MNTVHLGPSVLVIHKHWAWRFLYHKSGLIYHRYARTLSIQLGESGWPCWRDSSLLRPMYVYILNTLHVHSHIDIAYWHFDTSTWLNEEKIILHFIFILNREIKFSYSLTPTPTFSPTAQPVLYSVKRMFYAGFYFVKTFRFTYILNAIAWLSGSHPSKLRCNITCIEVQRSELSCISELYMHYQGGSHKVHVKTDDASIRPAW